MLDIDHFKIFNDTYKHAAGDGVLRQIGNLLREKVRASDIACRYGGEEFVVVLLDTDLPVALPAVERIVATSSKAMRIQQPSAARYHRLCGIGAVPVHGSSPEDSPNAADEALYAAKLRDLIASTSVGSSRTADRAGQAIGEMTMNVVALFRAPVTNPQTTPQVPSQSNPQEGVASRATLDRFIHAWQARLTQATSPAVLGMAFADWALHFATRLANSRR